MAWTGILLCDLCGAQPIMSNDVGTIIDAEFTYTRRTHHLHLRPKYHGGFPRIINDLIHWKDRLIDIHSVLFDGSFLRSLRPTRTRPLLSWCTVVDFIKLFDTVEAVSLRGVNLEDCHAPGAHDCDYHNAFPNIRSLSADDVRLEHPRDIDVQIFAVRLPGLAVLRLKEYLYFPTVCVPGRFDLESPPFVARIDPLEEVEVGFMSPNSENWMGDECAAYWVVGRLPKRRRVKRLIFGEVSDAALEAVSRVIREDKDTVEDVALSFQYDVHGKPRFFGHHQTCTDAV